MPTDPATAYAPRLVRVAAPPFLPRPYGLFSVVSIVDETDPHAYNGTVAEPDAHEAAASYLDGCTPAAERDKTDVTSGVLAAIGYPVTVYAAFDCAPVGYSTDEVEARARQALLNGEERALEQLLATGVATNGENFDAGFTPAALALTPAPAALGALEETIAKNYGGVAVLHVPTEAIPTLFDRRLIERDGQRLVTSSGRHYVTSNPYLDVTAGNAAVAWTGQIVLRRGSIDAVGEYGSSLDRSVNRLKRLVERTTVYMTDYPEA